MFVEVKTRRGAGFGSPAEAVGAQKARRLRRLAAQWLAAHGAGDRAAVRFDVVSVAAARPRSRVEHLAGVF